MVDVEMLDKMFEAGRAGGVKVCWCHFDRRAMLPWPALPEAVSNEAHEAVSEEELRSMVAEGWFPLLKDAGGEGVPLYAPSRIGFFRKLQREGYGDDELRLVASFEEWMIDNVLAADELEYLDDDLELLILYAQGQVDAIQHSTGPNGAARDHAEELSGAQRYLDAFRRWQGTDIPDALRPTIEKHAFRARAVNDMVRIQLLDWDRNKVLGGYSPVVQLGRATWSAEEGFRGEEISWDDTLQCAVAHTDAAEPPLRVPGFLLRGDRVQPTRTLRPADYARVWREDDIDGYLMAWARLRGERRCLNCFEPLAAEADDRKRFCGDKCRNASKQRRHRERRPEAVEMAQKRYWESVDL
jgi:hypothetical protein